MAGACDSVTRLLSPYVDEELAGADRAVVDDHLRGCKDCQGRLADLKATKAAMSAYFAAQADAANFAGFTSRVMQQIRKEPLPFGQRVKLWWAEQMTYHATAMYSGFGAVAAAAAIVVLAVRPGPAPAGDEMVVHSLTVSDPRYAPVVMHTDDGESVVMFVEHAGDQDDSDTDGGGQSAQPVKPAGDDHTLHGGNL